MLTTFMLSLSLMLMRNLCEQIWLWEFIQQFRRAGSNGVQSWRAKSFFSKHRLFKQAAVFYLQQNCDFRIHLFHIFDWCQNLSTQEFVIDGLGWECPSRVWRRARRILLVLPAPVALGYPDSEEGGVRACGSFLITLIATQTRPACTDREKTTGHLIGKRNLSDILSQFLAWL